MRNITHTFKRGEVGKVIEFLVEDANGPYDLTAWTVTLNLDRGSTSVVEDAAVTKRTQSGETLGQCYHTWDATTANIPVGKYKAELKLVNGSNVLYWPVDENDNRAYIVVKVQKPLG